MITLNMVDATYDFSNQRSIDFLNLISVLCKIIPSAMRPVMSEPFSKIVLTLKTVIESVAKPTVVRMSLGTDSQSVMRNVKTGGDVVLGNIVQTQIND